MEYLYVCHFSNGHIKVGRSVDPMARIATHADRVACIGVELVEHFTVECEGAVIPAENCLIARCNESATARHLDEWFVGLDYGDVVRWACDAAAAKLEYPTYDSRWRNLLADLKRFGMTQMQIADHCGCDQSTISALNNGRAGDPRYSLGEKLIALHASRQAAHSGIGRSHPSPSAL